MKTVDFDLTEAANALDIPIISDSLKTMVTDALNKFLVLPNRLVIPVLPDFDKFDEASLKTPDPKVFNLFIKSKFLDF